MSFVLPEVQSLLAQLQAMTAGQPKLRQMPLDIARASMGALGMLADLPAPDVPKRNAEIAGVPVRHYRPANTDPDAVFVYFHGGGFVIGDLDSHDSIVAQIAVHLNMNAIAVHYRLAPEHPYPAPHDDCAAVTRAIIDGGANRIFVGGDSAGGNLAAVIAQRFHNSIHGQLLLYPVTDFSAEGGSMDSYAHGFFLEREDMDWFIDALVQQSASLRDPGLSPAFGSLEALPPCVIVTCGLDPLHDQGAAYARALIAAGNTVRYHNLDGVIHGAFNMRRAIPAAQTMLLQALDDLKAIAA